MKPISDLPYDQAFFVKTKKAQSSLLDVGTLATDTSALWTTEKALKATLLPLSLRIMNGEENAKLQKTWFAAQRAWLTALRAAQEVGGKLGVEMEKYARLRMDVLVHLGYYLPTMEEAEKQKEGMLNGGPKLGVGHEY